MYRLGDRLGYYRIRCLKNPHGFFVPSPSVWIVTFEDSEIFSWDHTRKTSMRNIDGRMDRERERDTGIENYRE